MHEFCRGTGSNPGLKRDGTADSVTTSSLIISEHTDACTQKTILTRENKIEYSRSWAWATSNT